MAQAAKAFKRPHVSCQVCLKEVPKSKAAIVEARDYVAYFCSPECYDKWRRGRQPEDQERQ